MSEVEKNRKVLAIALTIAGVLMWFFAGSSKEVIQDLIKGVGMGCFIYGLVSINKFETNLKKSKVTALVVGALLALTLILGIIFFILK